MVHVDSHASTWADKIEINDITLSVDVLNPRSSFAAECCLKESYPEFFRIVYPDSDRCKHSRLVAPAGMPRVQPVVETTSYP